MIFSSALYFGGRYGWQEKICQSNKWGGEILDSSFTQSRRTRLPNECVSFGSQNRPSFSRSLGDEEKWINSTFCVQNKNGAPSTYEGDAAKKGGSQRPTDASLSRIHAIRISYTMHYIYSYYISKCTYACSSSIYDIKPCSFFCFSFSWYLNHGLLFYTCSCIVP